MWKTDLCLKTALKLAGFLTLGKYLPFSGLEISHQTNKLVRLGYRFLIPLLLLCRLSRKEHTCQCRKHRFDPLVRKIPWRRKWQPTPVFFLAWEIPWTEERCRLQSMGSQRVQQDLVTKQQLHK